MRPASWYRPSRWRPRPPRQTASARSISSAIQTSCRVSQAARPDRLEGVIHRKGTIMSHTQSRLSFAEQSPDLVKKLQDFGMAIAKSGHIDIGLALLVDIRASQMNGCAFCLDMHVKEAKLRGERELRLY